MKKIVPFLLAATVATTALPQQAEAVDIHASGYFVTRFTYIDNIYLTDDSSGTYAGQSFGPYLKFSVSENLSATLSLGVGSNNIGYGSASYSAGTYTGLFLKTAIAYADFSSTSGDFKARIGMQSAAKLSYTFGLEMLSTGEMAGVRTSYNISDKFAVEAAWYRPYTQSHSNPQYYTISEEHSSVDVFQLHFPMHFSNVSIIPTAQMVLVGDKSNITGTSVLWVPALFASSTKPVGHSAFAWFAGATSKMTIGSALTISADALYGDTSVSNLETADRSGYLVGTSANYAMDFATISALGWYSSGDDDNPNDGSERMPQYAVGAGGFKPAQKLGGRWANDLHFSQDPTCYLPGGGVGTPVGTWGLGVGISNMSFLDKLNHSLWTVYSAGTNDEKNVTATSGHDYLGTKDSLWQIGLTNWYNLRPNLVLRAEAVYGMNMYDDKRRPTMDKNPMRISSSFIYIF